MIIPIVAIFFALATAGGGSNCLNSRSEEGGREYFEHGEYLVVESNAEDAVPFYRTAVRMCPQSGYYLQRLGEVESMIGLYDVAWKRFKKALTLEGSDNDVIESHLNQPHFSALQEKEKVEHDSNDYQSYSLLPERFLSDINSGFSKDYPFVVRKGFELACFRNFTSLDTIRSMYGNELVEFYPQNMQVKPKKVYKVNLKKALDYFDYPDGAYVSSDVSEVGAYIQWNINVSHFHKITKVDESNHSLGPLKSLQNQLRDFMLNYTSSRNLSTAMLDNLVESFAKKSHWYMMLVGEENAGMFVHTDNLPVGSWQITLAGEKRWVICTPSPIDNQDSQQCENHEAMNGFCMAKNSCMTTVVGPGDILFYPPNYWHKATCLDTPTISLSGTVITDHELLATMINNECRSHQYGYHFDENLCSYVAEALVRADT